MIDVFIAYSHYDLPYKDELKKFLRPLLREERISMWDDFDIEAGQDWDAKIKERLYGADFVLLLVSADSLASDYFYSKEVKVSLERHARGEAIVVPVILRHCDWMATPLGSLEVLPEKGRPVVDWPTRDQAFLDVVSRLRRVVESLELKHKNASAEAEALQQFQAVCLAADHLYEKQNWSEAASAYASALTVYRPGFVPDRSLLETRKADCEAQLLAAQNAEDQRIMARAAEEKRVKNTLVVEAQRTKEAESQRQRAEKELLAEVKPEEQIAPTNNSTKQLLLSIGVGAALIALLLIWSPWSPKENKRQQQPDQAQPVVESPMDKKDERAQEPVPKQPSEQGKQATSQNPTTEKPKQKQSANPLPNDTEAADFAAAKKAGNIPALRSFLGKTYPREQFADEAKRLVVALENRVRTLLNDAAQFPNDSKTACELLRQAAVIDPKNAQILNKQNEIGCHGRPHGG